MASAVVIHGQQSLTRELGSLASGSLDDIDRREGRRRIWNANLEAASRYSMVGTGIGTHREVYPMYFEQHSPVEFTHAESGYIQILVEAGVPGVVLLLIAMILVARWCLGPTAQPANSAIGSSAAALIPGIVASVVHSIFDFVWYIPACMSVTIVLMAMACRLRQLNHTSPLRSPADEEALIWLPRFATGALAVVMSVIGFWMARHYYGPGLAAVHWDRYLAISLANNRDDDASFADWIEPETTQADLERATSNTMQMYEHLDRALRADGHNARTNLRLAAICPSNLRAETTNRR